MTFDDILARVITLLQRQGRVSYRALKMRFNLDDAYLDVLKEELIDAQRIAMDEDGRILVWIGDPTGTADTASSPVQSTQPPPAHHDQLPQKSPPLPTPPHTLDAERRQLTVMFCDLVESTALSGQLDPEDLREVIQTYHRVCAEVITRFDGYIAQYLGDGLLIYFGYPHAHEDDAHRAVHTGLGILDAMGDLNKKLEQEKGITLALRLGIHTGLVVVGAMGGGGRQEQLALGETPNVAARIQGLAASNTVIISDASYRLVQGYFACQALGAQTLRGVGEPITVYRVLSASGAQNRLDIVSAHGLTPLVGREQEVGLLLERWAQVKAGHGQVVLLTGDAGIGKSRLVQVLKDQVATEPHVRWECRSAEYYKNTALFPLTDLFQRLLQFQEDDTSDEKLRKLEHALSQYRLPLEESVPLFAPLLSLSLPESRYAPLHVSPQRQRQKTLETIVAILLELAERQPALFILEDLHWTDPTTLELLGLLLDQTPTAALLVLLTCRSHFQPAWHHRSYLTEMTVHRLSPPQIAHMAERVAGGKTFPDQVQQLIIAKTDGVPLFVEELTKAMLESDYLKETNGHYALAGAVSSLAIPTTLHDSLMARLDRLVTAKAVAQYAAVIGRQFAYDVLSTVSQLDEVTLQRELGRLVEAEIVYQRGVPPQATYTFKHALIQDAAYQSLLKSTRQQYHQRIAHILEARFAAVGETQPEILAHHYTEAGLAEPALPYWQRAGQRALQRSAYTEAIAHLSKGLEILTTLPDTPARAQHELTLHTVLGVAVLAIKGFAAPEVERVYARAREICRQVGDTPQLLPVLCGLWAFYEVRGELQTGLELAEQFSTLAQRFDDAALLLEACYVLGDTFFWLGAFGRSRVHAEQGVALYEPQHHHALAFLYGGSDPGIACRSFAALDLWFLGYPDQALTIMHEALALARELSHTLNLAFALDFAASLHTLRREGPAAQERAEAAMAVAREHDFAFYLAFATVIRGWALAEQGEVEAGRAELRRGLAAYEAIGATLERPYWLALLAEASVQGGRYEEGLTALAEALVGVRNMGMSFFYEAELYRLKGELLRKQAVRGEPEAEDCFRQALEVARQQQTKSLELRAAVSLSRLWQQQGKRAEARELLASVYHWFTEGFDTADLQEARALLAELSR